MIVSVVIILSIIMFGFSVVSLLDKNLSFSEKTALGFLLGSFVVTLQMFVLNLLGLELNILNLFTTLVINNAIFYRKLNFYNFKPLSLKDLKLHEIFLLAIIIFVIFSSIISNIYLPVRHWDALTLYDFRGKLFAQNGYIIKSIFDETFFGYPLLTSLLHSFLYISGLNNPSIIYSLFYISYIVILFEYLKTLRISRFLVYFFTLLFLISPRLFDHSTTAYTNLPYLIYYVLSVIFLVRKKYFLSSLFLAGSIWTRSAEPFYISVIVVATYDLLKQKKMTKTILFIFTPLFVIFLWRWFFLNYNPNITTVVKPLGNLNILNMIIESTFFYFDSVIRPYWAYILLSLYSIIINYQRFKKLNRVSIILFINLAMAFAGTFVFVSNFESWRDISDSLTRMMMLVPCMSLLSLHSIISKNARNNTL